MVDSIGQVDVPILAPHHVPRCIGCAVPETETSPLAALRRPARLRRSGRACGTFPLSQLPITGRWLHQPPALRAFIISLLCAENRLQRPFPCSPLPVAHSARRRLTRTRARRLPANKAAHRRAKSTRFVVIERACARVRVALCLHGHLFADLQIKSRSDTSTALSTLHTRHIITPCIATACRFRCSYLKVGKVRHRPPPPPLPSDAERR